VTISQISSRQLEAVREMMREYFDWAFSLEDGSEEAPTFQNSETELENLPGIYAPPQGRFLIAEVDGEICGTVALKPINEQTGELKRLYVKPGARGHGLGVRLVNELIREAREIGYARIILDSHRSMASAHAVYRALGFRNVEPPDDFPESLKAKVVFMEMRL
jgi:N-acetylglutamate synthase-like GNAT family acetyltransferase